MPKTLEEVLMKMNSSRKEYHGGVERIKSDFLKNLSEIRKKDDLDKLNNAPH
jgi:hypothetical protein